VNHLLQAALNYAERGWLVFPCHAGDKRPCGRLVPHGLKDATTDPVQIERWWVAEPKANVALVTGLNFDVLDVDGDTGWHTLAHLTAELGCLSSSPVALTPRGGAHYLFQPTGCGNRAGFRPSLDWRGSGGYVVAAPSLVGGRGYTWGVSPEQQAIEPAPEWLVQLLTKPPVPAPAPVPLGASRGTSYAQAALWGECEAIRAAVEGTRNHTLNVAAFRLGSLVAVGALDAEEAAAALYAAGRQAGLGEHETITTVRSGMSAGMQSPRRVAS